MPRPRIYKKEQILNMLLDFINGKKTEEIVQQYKIPLGSWKNLQRRYREQILYAKEKENVLLVLTEIIN